MALWHDMKTQTHKDQIIRPLMKYRIFSQLGSLFPALTAIWQSADNILFILRVK